MKPTKCPAKGKQMRQEKQNKREERKQKLKVKVAVLLLNPQNLGLSAHAELRKLIFCIWIRKLQSVRSVNRFVVSFSS